MSLKLEKEAFALPLDDPRAKLLLVAMCHLSAQGEVYASRLTLRRMTGMNDREISRKRNILVQKKLLKKIENDHYFITLNKNSEASEKDIMSIEKDTMSMEKDIMSMEKDIMSIPIYRNGTNGMNGTALLKILDIELKKLYHRKKEHPGNPDIPNAVERDHPDRLAYWELDALGKKIQKKMDAELLQIAS